MRYYNNEFTSGFLLPWQVNFKVGILVDPWSHLRVPVIFVQSISGMIVDSSMTVLGCRPGVTSVSPDGIHVAQSGGLLNLEVISVLFTR